MYRVSADRAVSYAYLIMMGSCRDGRNLPEVSQHLIDQSMDALHKIIGLDLAALIRSRSFSHSAVILADFR